MRTLISKIKNSEFLSSGELLKLKISLVLTFLFLFGILTIPVSIIGEFSLEIRIFLPSIFLFLFILSLIFLVTNRLRTSMHSSIYSFVGLTMYYTLGSSHLYGYLLIFITLTIIIFYQDIYTYIIYGGALTVYGIIYIQTNGDVLMGVEATSLLMSNLVYQGLLITFFVIFLIHFILSESIYDNLNDQYFKTKTDIKAYQKVALRYDLELADRNNENQLYHNESFKSSVEKISQFISKVLDVNSRTMYEFVEFYFFLYRQDLEEIKQSKTDNVLIKKYTVQLEKYMLNKPTEMTEILYAFAGRFKTTYKQPVLKRFNYDIDSLTNNKVEQLILLCYMYIYLRSEPTQFDKWGRVESVLTHDEVKSLFTSNEFRGIISYSDMVFFVDNEELFKKYFS